MKTNLLKPAALVLVPAVMLTITACSPNSGTERSTAREAGDGAIIVDTFTKTATVTGIDAPRRELTLWTPNGSKGTYKAGPEVVNFGQIQIGDQVKAVVTEGVAITIRKGTGPIGTSGTRVALAPVGAKAGAVMVDTTQITAKVTAVDTKKHKITFQLPNGTTETVRAARKVALSAVQPGDDVTIEVGEGLIVTVEKS